MSLPRVRIVLADDHAVVRQGIRELLDGAVGMEVVGEAADGSQALRLVRELDPDVLLLDLNMPGPGGVAVCERARSGHPDTRVLILTMHASRGQARRLLDAGAAGYAVKNASIDELLDAIRAVMRGSVWIDPVLAGEILGAPARAPDRPTMTSDVLSPREEEVLRKIAWGHPNKRIGEMLGISTRTVETYKVRIRDKLGLRTRADMVRYALEQGWMRREEPDR